jgi:hypothetical protein
MAIRIDGARRLVARHNTIHGAFNGVSFDNTGSGRPRTSGSEWDIHDNTFKYIMDDPIEPSNGGNHRIWRNRAEHALTWMSSGPTSWGPSYWWDNLVYQCGSALGCADFADATPDPEVASLIWKCGGGSAPQTRFYIWNNTFWTDDPLTAFSSFTAAAAGSSPEWMILRNNIVRVGQDCWNGWVSPKQIDSDYQQYGSENTAFGFRSITSSGTSRVLTFAAFRAAQPTLDATSNLGIADIRALATLDAQFVDAAAGDLTLVAGSVLRTSVTSGVATAATPQGLGTDDYLGAVTRVAE